MQNMHRKWNQTTTRKFVSNLFGCSSKTHHSYGNQRLFSHLANGKLFAPEENSFVNSRQNTVYDARVNICGKSRQDVKGLLQATNDPAFSESSMPDYRINELFRYIYHHGETDFLQMHKLSKAMKLALNNHFKVEYCNELLDHKVDSTDGTRKLLLAFDEVNKKQARSALDVPSKKDEPPSLIKTNTLCAEKNVNDTSRVKVESVFIPDENRGTVCVSSQVGCSLSCKFCHTGTQALERNLQSDEIVRQVMMAKKVLGDFNHRTSEQRKVSHVVFMGQGEPLYNYRNVKKAIEVMGDDFGLKIGQRTITVSTSGIVPVITRLNQDFPRIHIAISLHATTDELRNELVPINKTYNIATLMDTLHNLPNIRPSRKIMFEYVMLRGINDSFADAERLVQLLDGLPAIVNLIPFNSWPESGFESSTPEHIEQFSNYISSRGIRAPVRWSKGFEILGACGQLRSSSKLKEAYIKLITSENTQIRTGKSM